MKLNIILVIAFIFFLGSLGFYFVTHSNYESVVNYFGPESQVEGLWLHPKNKWVKEIAFTKVVTGILVDRKFDKDEGSIDIIEIDKTETSIFYFDLKTRIYIPSGEDQIEVEINAVDLKDYNSLSLTAKKDYGENKWLIENLFLYEKIN